MVKKTKIVGQRERSTSEDPQLRHFWPSIRSIRMKARVIHRQKQKQVRRYRIRIKKFINAYPIVKK